ncbi:hypothetical protein EAH78_16250 [Pseudomonas arsenicoxydans]|uniref:Uncharacterized protein n=1 Tax=Pseudomonas arsenicoxydans TaxID=702115 RepID=A0A502HPV1_9PSED|nr:hypothetical protein EAH78_16250 [Pseudomonas arsenicoxydans]
MAGSRSPRPFKTHTEPVGAGLLAKGPSASTSLLTDTSHSRASPLPQGLHQPNRFQLNHAHARSSSTVNLRGTT